MELEQYLSGLTEEKRAVLLGRETGDPLHEAFASKRVVHAGLMGEPVAKRDQQAVWQRILDEPADRSRQHAVYIHIPFCQTRCLYCGFFQNLGSREQEDEYVDLLIEEMYRESHRRQFFGTPIDSVYLGGGTPTSLSAENAERLLAAVRENFNLTSTCEFTIEGRVHDLVPEKIRAWLDGGVNRVSLGVQSFDTNVRRQMGRLDSREEVLARLAEIRRFDVAVIADLIYGLPGQTMDVWLDDVKTLAATGVDGIDLYQLNTFPGGRLEQAVKTGKVPAPATIAEQADMYIAAREYLADAGFSRLSLCHWSRGSRERSLYNTMAKTGAVVYPFGCGAGGKAGGFTFMQQRQLAPYTAMVCQQQKPIMMMAAQAEKNLQEAANRIVAGFEQGYIDFRSLSASNHLVAGLKPVLSLWERRGLGSFSHDGMYRLTPAGEFWYISLTQSLLECLQVLSEPAERQTPVDESAKGKSDNLDELLQEMLPQSTPEERQRMVKKMPMGVRMMLRHASRDTMKRLLAGLPADMLQRMIDKAKN